jgi:hypothetical protein
MLPLFLVSTAILFCLNCLETPVSPDNGTQHPQSVALDLFPFENQTNWWSYSYGSMFSVKITVVDTISADTELFYKVKFEEAGKDTTLDWFVKTNAGIEFGSSIRAVFNIFLPKSITKPSGSFTTSTGTTSYEFDSVYTSPGKSFHNAVNVKYVVPVLHGFTRIIFADSIGIVSMIDSTSRIPIIYTLDSCSVNDKITRF